MKKIFIVCLSQLFIMCGTTQYQVRNDFKSVSENEKIVFLKELNASSNSKSVIILTQGFKGEKISAKQENKTIYSQYPITNLKTKYAASFSFKNNQDLIIIDDFSKKEITIPTKQTIKYKFVYVMKKYEGDNVNYKITLSNTLRPLQ